MAAITNYTGDGEWQTLLTELFCSAELTGTIHSQLICLSVLNIFLSITAFLGNTLILVALYKETSLHLHSKVFLRNLAITDLFVGIIVEPIHVAYWISAVKEQLNICRFSLVAIIMAAQLLCSVSQLTLAAISVDRLLALLLGVRYRQVVTLKRTYVTVISLWFFSAVGCIMYGFWSKLVSSVYSYIILTLSLVISIYSYTRIFLGLRYHQTQIQDNVTGQPNETIPLNIARYRKTVSTVLWLQLTLVFCYLPYVVVGPLAIRKIRSESLSSTIYLVHQLTITLIYFNSSLNLLLYYWKINEVRQAVKDTVRHLFCSSS